ncbi:MAG: undecaprenyl-phosphate glucose phosphotransferase [Proteobacteria bacterium]|nr:undecaprenyl-phosphate glucose phosphotransferase [Pseudomonadota bacterium]
MSLPLKKNTRASSGDPEHWYKPNQKSSLTQSAPWSFQRRNDVFGFALLASLFGPLSLYGWELIQEPRLILEWACLFSLSLLTFRVLVSAPERGAHGENFSLLLKLLFAWGICLFVYSEIFSELLFRERLPWERLLFSEFLVGGGTWLAHLLVKKARPLLSSSRIRAVVVGVTPIGTELYNRSQAAVISDLNVLRFFDFRKDPRIPLPMEATFLDSPQVLAEYIDANQIDLVIITLPMQQEKRIVDLVALLSDTTASVAFVPDIFQFDLMNSSLGELCGVPVITLRDTPFYGWKKLLKRSMDLLFGCVLLMVFSPLLLVIGLIIKLHSPGPVLFRQKRVGLGIKPLDIVKFRTMYVQDPNTYPKPAEKNDPRVTQFGKWLRKYSLDELPQLLNVVRGEMSLVGPRPFPWEHSEEYRSVVDGYNLRHKIKPGMTGWAQVNGHRGRIETTEQLKARVEHDLYYVKHWSLLFDLLILLKSIPKVFTGDKNAF